MNVFSLEHLKQAMKLGARAVPLPEFGDGCVGYIAELSADERDERLEVPWLKRREESGDDSNAGFRAFAVAACWCDAERNFVAKNGNVASVAAELGRMDSRPVTRLFIEAAKANGLTADDEDAEKN